MSTQPASLSATKLRGSSGKVIILALTVSLLAGCAQPAAMITGPFKQTNRIDPELRRGVSTKADVERILGKPNGTGGTLMPPTQTKPGDVWVYYNSQTGTPRISGTGYIQDVEMDSRDQMIMIFFDRDMFDGYLWFLHVASGAAKQRSRGAAEER